ncbi:MAG TPA: squalene/phytoene synthase family protein, partial [Nannocystaceae bacterium]|nr:squalene/phytoene synthase family protein [Nannocystaceae bacterium]
MAQLGTVARLPLRGAALLRRLTKRSSSNFAFAFLFLGPEQRDALKQVYEFCRVVDDVVDERPPGPAGVELARTQLAEWSSEVERIFAVDPDDPPRTPLGAQLAETHRVFRYP